MIKSQLIFIPLTHRNGTEVEYLSLKVEDGNSYYNRHVKNNYEKHSNFFKEIIKLIQNLKKRRKKIPLTLLTLKPD